MTINIPTLGYYRSDYDKMFRILRDVNQWEGLDNVAFDFSQCRFLAHNAVAFLGGLARLLEDRGCRVAFAWHTLNKKILNNLERNRFLSAFSSSDVGQVGNAIPYREERSKDKNFLMDYLKVLWLGRGWVHVSQELSNAIVGRVWEIYENAFEHSHTPVGIFCCGQHYPKSAKLDLTVVDFGVGIPYNVRNLLSKLKISTNIPDSIALELAFRDGISTKPSGTGRGLGLGLLKEFVSVAKGKLEIFSNEAYSLIQGGKEIYSRGQVPFEGTLINISLHCDEKLYYCFIHEMTDNLPVQKGE
ncbi:MAG: ATP-binding protein [candidate division WOR-3 bacterium]|nr:ATP-binding protein [candidate division WOR-3 bacterium]